MARLAPLTMRTLMGAPPRRRRAHRPLGERPLRPVGVRQVGLEHDAGAQGEELGLVQDLAEGGHREVEVAVLLHVEVDELRRDPPVRMPVPVVRGRPVERPQPLGDARDRVPERDEVDLAEDGRDLHGDVLDVVAGQEREIGLQATRGLRVAEDGLAELVEVQAEPGLSPLLEIAPEVLLLAGQDDVLRLVAQAAHDGGHHDAGEVVRHGAAQEEPGALPPVHVPGHAVPLQEVRELIGDALGAVATEGLIREGDGQRLAVRIGHHAGELATLGALVRRLLGASLAEERFGQLERAVREVPLARRAARGIHARFPVPVYGGSASLGGSAGDHRAQEPGSDFLLSSTRHDGSTTDRRRVRLAR